MFYIKKTVVNQKINILYLLTLCLIFLKGACEGLSAASMCVRYPHALKSQIVQRNASLQETNKSRYWIFICFLTNYVN